MLHAVIMAGGSGTRFWPLSRNNTPKQLLPITGRSSMIEETIQRLENLVPEERIWVVTNSLQVETIKKLCPQIKCENFLIEPFGRNTAACIGLAATAIKAIDPQDTMVVLPADHLITPKEEFQRSITKGADCAASPNRLITFGITPSFPATGYGYIQKDRLIKDLDNIKTYNVKSFTEKPDTPKAERFLASGNYLWNAGIFIWRADSILNAIKKHMPTLHKGLCQLDAKSLKEQEILAGIYETLPSIPIDIGILEKSSNVQVIETNYQWSDVGSWKALYDLAEKDSAGNASLFPNGGGLLTHKAKKILAYAADGKSIATVGLQDIVIISTKDAILVVNQNDSEEVKYIVQKLQADGSDHLL